MRDTLKTAHFNRLTPTEAEAITMLAEEATEIAKACMKILRHGFESHNPHDIRSGSNREHLEKEIGDLFGVFEYAADRKMLSRRAVIASAETKIPRARKYMHHFTEVEQ